MTRASGCGVWDQSGRESVDYIMALGAVALGYGHPTVNRAATAAINAGVVGPLPPVSEQELADALAARIPWLERVRFLKDRKSTHLNSSHSQISYAVFCLKKKTRA